VSLLICLALGALAVIVSSDCPPTCGQACAATLAHGTTGSTVETGPVAGLPADMAIADNPSRHPASVGVGPAGGRGGGAPRQPLCTHKG